MGASAKAAEGPVDLSNDDLLVLFVRGDQAAAAALTARLAPRALAVAMRMMGNRAEAEDITQEAMIRLWRMAPDWQPGKAQVSTWLYRVVSNLCIDVKRRARGGTLGLDDVSEPADNAASALEALQQQTRHDALQQALMQLPVRQRQAVVLRHIEELSNPEIADIMDIGVEAVESLTARAKRGLAKALAARKEELGYTDG
ncbi:RNA polymerase sigma factor [Epibacterium sp. SM1969]|uniref:RNA polymerase sigma factor n=1 Tax=Tritonibacter aquimaris TaxID=2663379 RepID=A0A844ALY4_9RHOB|nr:RNA polymerase sigma factor [Tritonibacter aquimaris]